MATWIQIKNRIEEELGRKNIPLNVFVRCINIEDLDALEIKPIEGKFEIDIVEE